VITSEILGSVVQIRYGDSTGTAFTVQNSSQTKQYLISARHIFTEVQDGDIVEFGVRMSSDWLLVKCKVHLNDNSNIDIAIFSFITPNYVTPAWEKPISSTGLHLGQDVYFCGFPFGLYMNSVNGLNEGRPFPLVKKACVSMVIPNEKINPYILLDGFNNPGFSGGPVCFHNRATNTRNIFAVISGYRWSASNVFFTENTVTPHIRENTGLIVAYTADWIPSFIEKMDT
jgi:hypothetical protein